MANQLRLEQETPKEPVGSTQGWYAPGLGKHGMDFRMKITGGIYPLAAIKNRR
jgi:hypothetical protein